MTTLASTFLALLVLTGAVAILVWIARWLSGRADRKRRRAAELLQRDGVVSIAYERERLSRLAPRMGIEPVERRRDGGGGA